jgi:PAS domain-containing protein
MTTDEDLAKSREELLEELIETRRSLAELSRFTKGLGPSDPESGSPAKLPLSVLFSLSDVIILTDPEGRFLYICPTVENVLGFSIEEVKSMRRVDRLLGENMREQSEPDTSTEIRNIRRNVLDKQGNE